MEILNIFVYLVVIFGCAVLSSGDWKTKELYFPLYPFICEATIFSTKLNSTIKCVDRFSYLSFDGYESKCFHYLNNKSMRIHWTPFHYPNRITPHKLTCTSSAPLSTEIYFENGVPKTDYANVRHERVKSQFGPSTQEYIMTLLLPDAKIPKYRDKEFAVKYKIFNKEDPEAAVNVLLTYYSERTRPCPLYSLSESFDVLLNREIMTIPCLSRKIRYPVTLFRNRGEGNLTENPENLKVDNHSVSYDPMEGFKINTTLLANSTGNYICCYNDEIRNQKDCLVYPVRKHDTSDTDGNITLHKWNIYWVNGNLSRVFRVLPLSYYNQRFHCTSEDDDLELRHMECETPTECQVFSKCLETKDVAGNRLPKVRCDEAILTTKGKSYVSQDIFISKNDYCSKRRRFKSGIVQCSSSSFNVLQPFFQGFDNQLYFTSEPPFSAVIALRILSSESDLYTKGRQILVCEAHQFLYEHGIQWEFKNLNGTSILPDFLHHVAEKNSDFRYPKSTIEVSFAEVTEVEIVCHAPPIDKRDWHNTTIILKLKKSLPPEFYKKDTTVFFDVNKDDQRITCQANGFPQPQIHWMRSNEVIEDESRIVDNVFKKVLLFPTYNESLSGEYICQASNIAGNGSLRFQVFTAFWPDVNGPFPLWTILISSGFCLGFLILFVFFAIYLRNEKVKKYREIKQVIRLLNGNADSTDNPIELPFDTKFDLEKHSFSFDKGMLLGKGEFGEVYKGRITGVDGFIAFKTLSQNCSMSHIKALVSEIKMLMYVGDHPNLVELIGVYRKEIRQGILYMGLEFCDLGSLESYLRTYKHLFMKCPTINSLINTDIVERAGKEVGELPSIHSMKTLIKWCYQIAYAMEYLGTKNVIHSDLAARNVLLTAEANAKVTDFGLSRRTYNYTEYVKTAKDALPWRWLALECLLTNTFSTKSDVWAYGITLWEIFSFGEMPYPGMAPSLEFVEQLKEGLRNIKPNYASQELYHVMRECWHPGANERPSFSALRIIFDSAMSRNESNFNLKISENCNLEEMAKELSAAVYCQLEEQ